MSQPHRTRAADLGPVVWRRPAGTGDDTHDGVEFAVLDDGRVAVRNAADPDGPVLLYTPAEISAFVDGAKKGEFDDMLD
ncbi:MULTISPECIES: DUF397 domain-containing protein [Pseudonocardia]|uniref:DUF397 domain-containing protein n=2 Tax=Pseudonocardia TaxID=1847 RepID=A0A1Y2N5Z5_PSEAH|nr:MULTISPECIES: DUF397 domain-containing protein [Pseudonocardia]OSY42338.1 hypothetical protein BG845_01258 [Pseudonocardia autotrophica]TDN75858.1 uncharacterized protein DUF397 [Pseudonocardia autotrophica]